MDRKIPTGQLPDFNGLEKFERRWLMGETGLLSENRFIFPADPDLRRNLTALKRAFGDYKKGRDEIIGATLESSYSKGYANRESDMDVWIFIDIDEQFKKHERERGHMLSSASRKELYQARLEMDIYLINREGKNQYERKREMRDLMEFYLLSVKDLKILEYGFDQEKTDGQEARLHLNIVPVSEERIIRIIKSSEIKKFWYLAQFFSLAIAADKNDRGIKKYRNKILSLLEDDPEGETKWEQIVDCIIDNERAGIYIPPREEFKKLYPKTISEAKEAFL